MIKKQLREDAMLKEKKIKIVYTENKIHDLVNSLTNNEFVEILNLISDRCIVQSEGIDRFFTLDLINAEMNGSTIQLNVGDSLKDD
jgi:hypothetical protein|tara:strand:- start:268 stop:525 length:258 start_codon:yes stop_codon:yes gene_type:complete